MKGLIFISIAIFLIFINNKRKIWVVAVPRRKLIRAILKVINKKAHLLLKKTLKKIPKRLTNLISIKMTMMTIFLQTSIEKAFAHTIDCLNLISVLKNSSKVSFFPSNNK